MESLYITPIRPSLATHGTANSSACPHLTETCTLCSSADEFSPDGHNALSPECPTRKQHIKMLDDENNPHQRTVDAPTRLKAMQYNVHHDTSVHNSLLSSTSTRDFDILFISEPYFYRRDNGEYIFPTSTHWTLIQSPSPPSTHAPRSVIYVSNRIPTACYCIIPTTSIDITAIAFPCPTPDTPFIFIHVYNPPESFSSLPPLRTLLLDRNILDPSLPFTVLGDFNLHSPLWDLPSRTAHPEPETDDLLEILGEVGAQLQSQPGICTFQNTRLQESVIDLAFTSSSAAALYLRCATTHDATHDHGSDHYPIIHEVMLDLPEPLSQTRRKWELADWTSIRDRIGSDLANWRNPAPTRTAIDLAVTKLTAIIHRSINDESLVPRTRPAPFSKRWWNEELDQLRTRANRARRRAASSRTQEDQKAWKAARSAFKAAVRNHKQRHWRDFLAQIDDNSLWTASKYATKTHMPRFIPPLQQPDGPPVSTPAEQAALFRETFFSPPAEADLSDIPQGSGYPRPAPGLKAELAIAELDDEIARMAPNKAPGPDEIPVLVLQRIWAEIRLPLFSILQAAYRIGYFPKKWREAISLILRKPGKPDYTVPNAYRPIALLCTLGKLFEGVLCRRLSHLVEANRDILPNAHIGCRPKRSTDDALINLTQRIWQDWRNHRVTACLQLDVKSAFTTVSRPRLIHNMRTKRIPEHLTRIIGSFLSDRKTSIKCGDHITEQHPCEVGIPQGSPLSGLLYLFYNAPLVDLDGDPTFTVNLDSQGYADDISIAASGNTAEEARAKLENATTITARWSRRSASTLDLAKTKYIVFTRNAGKKDGTPLQYGNHQIPPSTSVVYLGVAFDEELRWHEQGTRAAAKGHKALMALEALARTTWGVPLLHFKRLYEAIVVPRMDYGAIIWHKFGDRHTKTLHRLRKVHHLALRLMLGAFRTTPISGLEYDANITPPHLRLDRKVSHAAARLLSLPDSNPAGKAARRALARNVNRHRSPLHILFHSSSSIAFPTDLEILHPVLAAYPPGWTSPPRITTRIALDRIKALEDYNTGTRTIPQGHFHLFSDGSKTAEGVGAAAIDYINGRERLHRLGNPDSHTVYEAELVGISLALSLAEALPTNARCCAIHLDNQAAIIATSRRPRAQPGQGIIRQIHDQLKNLLVSHPRMAIELAWVPGHEGVEPNEIVDKRAKRATSHPYNDLTFNLKASLSATHERINSLLPTVEVESPDHQTGRRHRAIRGELTRTKTFDMLATLPRGSCSIVTQLRSGHISLSHYLHRFKIIDTAHCITCNQAETVEHFLLCCLRYRTQRRRLLDLLAKKGLTQPSLTTLLSEPKAIGATIAYVKSTRRFPLHTPAITQAPQRALPRPPRTNVP